VVFDQQPLSRALDDFNAALPAERKAMEEDIYQHIIHFRSKPAKTYG
jgi:hypothetical protein